MTVASSTQQFTIDPTGKKKVILSVDGGGMRGAIPIAMLAELENQTGKTCQQMFDMVAGTSTGAIIAVGLAFGLTAAEMLDEVYRKRLPEAFKEAGDAGFIGRALARLLKLLGIADSELLARLAAHNLRYAYPLEPFLEKLKPLVGCQTVGDLKLTDPKRPILLVTTKDVQTGNTYFIVNAGKGKDMFKDWPLAGVVGASGAAPVFFPAVLNRFVDGGVGVFTNPCLAASIEAMEYIGPEAGFESGKVVHISLGTGYVEFTLTPKQVENNNAIDWLRYVVLAGLNDAALQQVFANRAIYGDRSSRKARMDFRRYNPLLNDDNVSGVLGVSAPKGLNPADLTLDSIAPEQVELMFEIGRAYTRKIDWSVRNAMPWNTTGGHANPADTEAVPVDWTGTGYGC